MVLLSGIGRYLPAFVRRVVHDRSACLHGESFIARALAKSLKVLGRPLREYVLVGHAFGDEEAALVSALSLCHQEGPAQTLCPELLYQGFRIQTKEGLGVPLGNWMARPEFEPFLSLPLEERCMKRGW